MNTDTEMLEYDRSSSNMHHQVGGNIFGAKNVSFIPAENTQTSELIFKVERKMEFDSTRKRMSIIVKDPRDQKFKLYIKGAD